MARVIAAFRSQVLRRGFWKTCDAAAGKRLPLSAADRKSATWRAIYNPQEDMGAINIDVPSWTVVGSSVPCSRQ